MTTIYQNTFGDYEIAVMQLQTGEYLAHTGLKSIQCRSGDNSSHRQLKTTDKREAFRFLGWPDQMELPC